MPCDLKVGTYIHLIELMKSYEYSRSRSSLDIAWPKVIYILNLKLNFLRNHFTNQNFICGNLNGLGHMTKMAAIPIYVVKSFKINFP